MLESRVNIQDVSVKKIFPNPWNPNRQSDFVYLREVESIKNHGFLDPLLVRETDKGVEIIDGEHRFRAAIEIGYKKIPCNNLGAVSDSVAKQLTVLMNEVKGKADTGKMSDIMRDLHEELGMDTLELIMPYSKTELDALINISDVDWDNLSPDKTEGGEGSGSDESDWRTLSYRVPLSVFESFEQQVTRLKKRLHPDERPKDCSPVQAIEAITQHISQMSDEELVY